MKWKELIAPHVNEEDTDHDVYMRIADTADEEGCHHAAGVLRDIANEEMTHHHLLAEMLHVDNPQ